MNINTFDLNLLRIFDAVMREGNITAAGARLGITQPAMSHAVRRLRQLCNDPMFVRTTDGMKPTAYAQLLAAPVGQAIGTIRSALEINVKFDPATSTRTFSLLMTDSAGATFLPRLIPHLNSIAPGVKVNSLQMTREKYREALEAGVAELAIGQLPEIQRKFYQQHLFDEPLVCLMRKDHPAIGRTLSMQQFMAAEQICVSAPAQVDGMIKRALGKRAARRRIALHVPYYLVIPMILVKSDLIAVMPKGISDEFTCILGLKALPLPFKVVPIHVRQFWHERSHHDPGHRWLRGIIAKLFMTADNALKSRPALARAMGLEGPESSAAGLSGA